MESYKKPEDVEAVRRFMAAAIADGWDHTPTYGESEPESSACKLTRDGFVVSTISRDARADRWGHPLNCEASVHAWGPSGLSIKLGSWDYPGFEWFVSGQRRCNLCKAEDVDTFRYSFAGRACAACLPKAKAEYEKPGWCD